MNNTLRRTTFFLFAILAAGAVSCDLNKIDYSDADNADVQNEAVASAYFEDGADLSATAVSGTPVASAGGHHVLTIADVRFFCASISLDVDSGSTFLHPKGTITADFGTACADTRGSVRSGKIIITYSGRRFQPGSSISTTFSNYTINGVSLNGSFVVANLDSSTEAHPIFDISIAGGSLAWPDGKVATRNSEVRREWIRTTDGATDQWIVTGQAIGTNRNQKQFAVQIDEKLIYQKTCEVENATFLPSSGKETLIVSGKHFGIDYGSGSCDEEVTITINGKSTIVALGKGD